MFIPRGDIIYESLATSYVLVDALVADLCEGGFSGTVEVVLRDTDSFIAIAGGSVVAVLEKNSDGGNGDSVTYSRSTVEQLAERSRRERGRVSIYSYSPLTANAVAGRINAHPLYVGLSTEFTDLEKMIRKLSRERDREWFIEINREDGSSALLHMRDAVCGVINSRGKTDSGPLDLSGHASLEKLVSECTRVGGTFDVYFNLTSKPIAHTAEISPEDSNASNIVKHLAATADHKSHELSRSGVIESAETSSGVELGDFSPPPIEPGEFSSVPDSDQAAQEAADNHFDLFQDLAGVTTETTNSPDNDNNAESKTPNAAADFQANELSAPDVPVDRIESDSKPSAGLSLVRDQLSPVTADAEAMNEIKRLMGEMAKTIEEAAQAVGRPEGFSLALRAGQLKIADRYPFLDPFAGEFEYLAGEIVFVGMASPADFVAGFTEALRLAADAIGRSTAYPDRFRAYLVEDLNILLARDRASFEALGLDKSVGEILVSDQ